MTSQTCINILLNRADLQRAADLITGLHPEGIDAIEPVAGIALVAVVGAGLSESKHSLSNIMTSLYESDIPVEIIISGASKVAAYIIVPLESLKDSVRIVHRTITEPSIRYEG